MTLYTMTIIEDESNDELQVYVNAENKLFIQIESFLDIASMSITMGKKDAINLRDELTKLIPEIE